jgi:beta-lactamase superfamily II metal-dependent hydrolase
MSSGFRDDLAVTQTAYEAVGATVYHTAVDGAITTTIEKDRFEVEAYLNSERR